MTDALKEIKLEYWPKLRNKFLDNWPKHSLGFYTVDNYINWCVKDSGYNNFNFYSLNGDWSDGTYLIIDGYQVFAYTLDENLEKFVIILSLLPSDKNYLIAVESRFYEALNQTIIQKQWQITFTLKSLLYSMPKEKAVHLTYNNLPTDLELRPLIEENLDDLVEAYSFKSLEIKSVFKKLQQMNLNLAVFDECNSPLAWCLRHQSGLLYVLHTQEGSRNRGLASTIVKAMASQIAKKGGNVFTTIDPTNAASIGLFEKIGFTCTGDYIYWIELNAKS